jgi:hypothetical protein
MNIRNLPTETTTRHGLGQAISTNIKHYDRIHKWIDRKTPMPPVKKFAIIMSFFKR